MRTSIYFINYDVLNFVGILTVALNLKMDGKEKKWTDNLSFMSNSCVTEFLMNRNKKK